MALATDANPGSSPVFSMQSAMNMGCLLFGLTPQEAFIGATRNAAMALGMEEQVGTLEIGKYADMVLWDLDDPGELAYWVGVDSCEQVIARGNRIDLTVPGR
jgi:imidazolonepropionase